MTTWHFRMLTSGSVPAWIPSVSVARPLIFERRDPMSQLRWLLILVLAGGVFQPTSQVASAQEGKPPAPKKLLIVAPNSFHGALKPFVEHKKHLLPAETVSLETVLKNTKGADDAEKLKRYLYDRWK